jgi:general stress protein YciG
MNLKSLQRKAKQMIDQRGGTDSLKEDAEELKDIAKGPGSFTDKAKRAGDALKEPGAKGPDTSNPSRPPGV